MPEPKGDFRRLRQKAMEIVGQQPVDISQMSAAALQEVLHELRRQNDELRRARQEAEAERDRFAELYNSIPAGCLTVDYHGVILEANRASSVLLAGDNAPLVGRSLAAFVTLEDQPACSLLLRQAFKSGQLQQGKLSFHRAPGTPLVALVAVQVTSPTPAPVQTCRVVLSDITARQQAMDVMRQRDWLQVTLSNIGDGVIAADTQGRILFINREAERLTEWTAAEACNAHAAEVMRLVSDQTQQGVEHPVTRVLQRGSGDNGVQEAVLHTRYGRALQVAHRAAPICGENGRLYGVVLIFRDVTERKHLEEHLSQAQKMAAIGTLAGGIAHDFNNMLAVILGYAELALADVTMSALTQTYLQEVAAAGKRARDLVKQILAFSRQHRTQRLPVQLHLAVKEALTLLRATLPTTIDIQYTYDDAAGFVLADPTQLHQVVINLCANAGYAMRQAGGVLRLHVDAMQIQAAHAVPHPDLRPGAYVRLTVQDTGGGITPDVLPHIFEPYFTTKAVGEGTGLGLAVVHGIVVSYGGAITVHSLAGQGATFTVYLPSIVTTSAAASLDQGFPGGSERLLVIDDEEALARMGQAMLKRLGYDVVHFSSSVEALAAFTAAPHAFDLVLTDQTMPQITGDALVLALRQIRPDIPLILCTGFSHAIDADRARILGIDAFIMKPWELTELAHTLRQVLERRAIS